MLDQMNLTDLKTLAGAAAPPCSQIHIKLLTPPKLLIALYWPKNLADNKTIDQDILYVIIYCIPKIKL